MISQKKINSNINIVLNDFNRIISIDNGNNNILNKSFDKIFIINMESDFIRKKNILVLDDYNISYDYVNAITQDNSSIKDFCDNQSQKYKGIDYSTYENSSICLALSNLLILNYCIHNNIKKCININKTKRQGNSKLKFATKYCRTVKKKIPQRKISIKKSFWSLGLCSSYSR